MRSVADYDALGVGPELDNVAHAYSLMLPSNAVVYHNGREFGDSGFPRNGQGARGDALGGLLGQRISTDGAPNLPKREILVDRD